jgi:hypothetical protein
MTRQCSCKLFKKKDKRGDHREQRVHLNQKNFSVHCWVIKKPSNAWTCVTATCWPLGFMAKTREETTENKGWGLM